MFFTVDVEAGASFVFEGAVTADAIDISGGSGDYDFQGDVELTGGDFEVSGDGDVTTSNVDLDEYDLIQNGGGTFTMNSTLTVGDDNSEVAGTRVNNASGTMTIDNIVIEGVDDAGEDGSPADTDEQVMVVFVNSDVFVLNGTITETTIVDDDDADEDVTYAFYLYNANDALWTFNATTSFSGDVENLTTTFDNDGAGGDDEGVAVSDGVTITNSFAGDHTDLGYWGGDGTLDITAGTAAIDDLESAGNFILTADRDLDSGFTATGYVTIEEDGVDVSVVVDIAGLLTLNGDGITFTGDGDHEVGGLQVNGDTFVLGDDDDSLTSHGDVDLNDGTIDGDIDVDGDFTTDGGTITGNFDST
jgi:hypothetical protein